MVSIAAFQAVDPGSIPGRRSVLFVELGCSDASQLSEKEGVDPDVI